MNEDFDKQMIKNGIVLDNTKQKRDLICDHVSSILGKLYMCANNFSLIKDINDLEFDFKIYNETGDTSDQNGFVIQGNIVDNNGVDVHLGDKGNNIDGKNFGLESKVYNYEIGNKK